MGGIHPAMQSKKRLQLAKRAAPKNRFRHMEDHRTDIQKRHPIQAFLWIG